MDTHVSRLDDYARLSDQVRALRDGLAEVRATAYSDDGLVTVVVGGRGELLELDLDPRIYRDQNAAALADTVLATVRDASAKATREITRFAEQLLPERERGRDDVDPLFDPVRHLLDTGPARGVRRG